MIKYKELAKKPTTFKSLTGVSIDEFNNLLTQLSPIWDELEIKRLSRKDRQRAIGGGPKYKHKLQEQLLMTLMWLRLYLNTETLGFFFGVHKATVSRNTRRVLKALRQMGEDRLGWPEPPKRGEGKTVEQALREYPDLLAIVDATEQRVQRPGDPDRQKAHYSGKKKMHTRKTEIVVNEHGLMRALTESGPGSTHDITHFRQSDLPDEIPDQVAVLADKGFDGLHKDLPDHSVATPHKARRNHPLKEDQKLANREFASVRIVVEHTIGELKRFKILADCFRHSLELYDDVFRSVAGIVNVRISHRINQAAPV